MTYKQTNVEELNTPTDNLVPYPVVWCEFGVTRQTLARWDADPRLGFPVPVVIRGRKFRSRAALEEFKRRMMAEAIKQRAVGE